MDLERTADGFRAIDSVKNTVEVGVEGWEPASEGPSVETALSASALGPETADETVSGRTERLELPSVYLVAADLDDGHQRDFGGFDGTEQLAAGARLFRFSATVRVFLRTDASATLTRREPGGYELSFDEPTPVSLGFYSTVDAPAASIAVPPTPDGVADALSLAAATTTDTTPDRTWPTRRKRPPSITVGEDRRLPATLRDRRPDTGVEIVVPPDLRYLFTAASLGHYLGATFRTEPNARPRLLFDGDEEPLGTLPAFQRRTASLLRRVFSLDCVARSAGPHGGDLAVADTFDTLGLDAPRLYGAPVAERLRTYLDVPFDAVADRFPEWHLGMYVDPTYDHVETLPHFLSNLPQLLLPSATSLDKREFLERTISDGFAGPPQATADGDTSYRVRREVSSVDLVDPDLGPARTHGWLADDVPIDVFKTFPEAYENRSRYVGEADTPMSVVAVVVDRDMPLLTAGDTDDAAMRDEHTAAVDHYRDRAPHLNAEVQIEENVSTAELARIFEAGHDLVHYIGHRDDDGLECADGALSTESLSESNARTFFLNACGSYPEGRRLVQKGSVAGGVTFERVADDEAAEVGTAFARMMMYGFSMERAIDKARKQLPTPKDYAVVGDGTYVLTQTDTLVPPDVWVNKAGDDQFEVTQVHGGPWIIGGRIRAMLDDEYRLFGADRRWRITGQVLKELIDRLDAPTVYDGRLYWPEELHDELL